MRAAGRKARNAGGRAVQFAPSIRCRFRISASLMPSVIAFAWVERLMQVAALSFWLRYSSQIIAATQSPALIDGFDIKDIIVVERDGDRQSTRAFRLDAENLSDWLEDYTTSELWNKNIIGGRPV